MNLGDGPPIAVLGVRSIHAEPHRGQYRQAQGGPGLQFGLALHSGEVLYGNIGGTSKLDFTAIGPSVNLAARIETISGVLGRTIVMSSNFAADCEVPLESLGRFELKGFRQSQEVFPLPN